mmetsp:Transcript_54392/g.157269  ORF Transcript_54392/g.157269 Transcript_54392/m.157269 type:complete len:373 (+) Transcript_54392:324-1442(+)
MLRKISKNQCAEVNRLMYRGKRPFPGHFPVRATIGCHHRWPPTSKSMHTSGPCCSVLDTVASAVQPVMHISNLLRRHRHGTSRCRETLCGLRPIRDTVHDSVHPRLGDAVPDPHERRRGRRSRKQRRASLKKRGGLGRRRGRPPPGRRRPGKASKNRGTLQVHSTGPLRWGRRSGAEALQGGCRRWSHRPAPGWKLQSAAALLTGRACAPGPLQPLANARHRVAGGDDAVRGHQLRLGGEGWHQGVCNASEAGRQLLGVLEDGHVMPADLPYHSADKWPSAVQKVVHRLDGISRATLKLLVGLVLLLEARPLLRQHQVRPETFSQLRGPLVAALLRDPSRIPGLKGAANLAALLPALLQQVLHSLHVPFTAV